MTTRRRLPFWAMCLSLVAAQPAASFASQSTEQASGASERARRERDVHDRMQQRRADHFSVKFEGPEQVARCLERARSIGRRLLEDRRNPFRAPAAPDSGGPVYERTVPLTSRAVAVVGGRRV